MPATESTGICPKTTSRGAAVSQYIPKEETVGWWVNQTQEPLILQVGYGETRFRTTIEALNEVGLLSLCALPLSTAHSHLDSLIFASRIADAYSAEEVRFLSLVAGQIALAMDDAYNFQRLKLLLDFTNRVVSKLDLRELLREVSASIRRVMQCDRVGVVLSDPETGRLRLYAFDHPDPKGTVQGRGHYFEQASESLFKAFRTGQAVYVPEVDSTADPLASAEGLKSLCLLPLISRERIRGVLSLVRCRTACFCRGRRTVPDTGCESDHVSGRERDCLWRDCQSKR
jgi:formate hydrogenlyase transcriptional activator